MNEGLAVFHEVLHDLESDPDLEADDRGVGELRSLQETGERIRGWLLDHVHGRARPSTTPDLLALKRLMDEWIAAGNAFFAAIAAH